LPGTASLLAGADFGSRRFTASTGTEFGAKSMIGNAEMLISTSIALTVEKLALQK
jgi:hypothetical protein